MTRRIIFGVVLLLVLGAGPVFAQQRGQYIPGFTGLNSGIQAPEGATYANYFMWYPASTFKDRNGDEVPLAFDLDLIADFNVLAYTTKAKFLGAKYGMALAVPIVSTAVDLNRLGTGISPWGIGDIYVEPINLGWATKHANIKAAYGFVAPTGTFDPDDDDTTTTDFWGHEITVAATTYLTENKLVQLSINTNWEFHQGKRHSDLKVGNNMTLEYGLGKTWVHNKGKQLVQLGAVGYAEWQLTEDSGSAARQIPGLGNDRVFALGPELGVILPASKFNFSVRVLPEFGARSRTQGLTLTVTAGKSF